MTSITPLPSLSSLSSLSSLFTLHILLPLSSLPALLPLPPPLPALPSTSPAPTAPPAAAVLPAPLGRRVGHGRCGRVNPHRALHNLVERRTIVRVFLGAIQYQLRHRARARADEARPQTAVGDSVEEFEYFVE